MKSWSRPEVPRLSGRGPTPGIHDTSTAVLVDARPVNVAQLYVCGITPYDATHIGHAATYLAYDTLVRLWLDAGHEVRYVQNITDVDDPLLERATATGVDWRELAASQVELFRGDMRALRVIPPDHFVAVTEMIEPVADAVAALVETGIAYRVDEDLYFDSAAAESSTPWFLGQESRLGRVEMLVLSAERGGDPERIGKRDPLDPLLWRAERPGEPAWATVLGNGRPGWHIECSVIALQHLDGPLTVSGGGSDLVFPHHEFTAGHTAAITGREHAAIHSHAGLVSYQGEKMSKSLGNLVLVSELVASGVDPRAIRLALLAQRYRDDWEWTDGVLGVAVARLENWTRWAESAGSGAGTLVADLRRVLATDLNTPDAVIAVDARVAAGQAPAGDDLDGIDALLGIRLAP